MQHQHDVGPLAADCPGSLQNGIFAQQNEPGRETASEEALELKASHVGISLDALLRVWLDERLKTKRRDDEWS